MSDNKVQKGHILLVDDEEVIRDSVGCLLKENGFDVTVASGVDEALEKIKENSGIEVIISDIKMPQKTGIDLLESVHETSPNMPVILLTGYADVQTAQKAVTFGAYDYINKPVDEESKLIEPLNRAFEKVSLIKQNKKFKTEIFEMVKEREEFIRKLIKKSKESKEFENEVEDILGRYGKL